MKQIAAILGLCVTCPIGYYLLYQMLSGINATQLTWFLFWVYLPVSILVGVLTKLTEE